MTFIKEKKILSNFRALVVKNDCIIGARGYNLFVYDLNSGHLNYFAKVNDMKYALLSRIGLTRRLFRSEITNLYTLKDDSKRPK